LRIDQWTIEQGQYVVLLGPSGAGKTMFLETVAGLHEPDRGHIWIHDREVTGRPPERRGIGFVYQDCWLFPHLTVRQNIDFGRRYHGKGDAGVGSTAEELAEMLHVAGLLDRRPLTLSGGERQRVALARALAIRPRLLFLDEPLGTLDPRTRESVAAELQACHSSLGTTTIHVTHDHTEARMMGEATAVILDGTLVQSGPTDEVFQRPSTTELAGFLGGENLFVVDAAPAGLPDMVRVRLGDRLLEVRSDRTGRVAACIRPEDVLVEPAGDGNASGGPRRTAAAFPGRVAEVSPRGAMVRLVIDTGDHRWVSLISRSQQRSCRFGEARAVTLHIPADVVHLIPLE